MSHVINCRALCQYLGLTPFRATGPLVNVNRFLAATKFRDSETDLYYYGYRYYNPTTGRWLSRDPIDERGGMNLYEFVENAPVIFIDPLGQVKWMQMLGGALQVASGIAMWTTAGATGATGVGAPAAVVLAAWGGFSIWNGMRTMHAALYNQGSPEVLQVQAASATYQFVTGDQMSPTGLQITRSAYYAIDIVMCLYSIRASWTTATESGFVVRRHGTEEYVTPSMIQVQKVTSHMQFNWRVHHVPLVGSALYDLYGLWTDIDEWHGVIIQPSNDPPPPVLYPQVP
jgi:RHS repeat-associated protein